MTDPEAPEPLDAGPARSRATWLPWLAWGWVLLLVLATVAELTGWEDLRLALDFHRHLP